MGPGNDHAFLTRSSVDATAEQADDMAAVAFRLTRASGFYRAPAGASVVYLTFAGVTITPDGGQPETFAIRLA